MSESIFLSDFRTEHYSVIGGILRPNELPEDSSFTKAFKRAEPARRSGSEKPGGGEGVGGKEVQQQVADLLRAAAEAGKGAVRHMRTVGLIVATDPGQAVVTRRRPRRP